MIAKPEPKQIVANIKTNNLILIFTPLICTALYGILLHQGLQTSAAITASITLACAIFWVTECIPIPVTSLLPLALFPLLGVLSPQAVADAYGNPIILLLLGGFLLSTAMSSSGAHQQIALGMIKLLSKGEETSYRRLVLAFMLTSALISMWISNTATTLMLLPIALAVLDTGDTKKVLAVPLLLGICYAASVGGIGTPIGTPPNLIFMRVYSENTGLEITFLEWMAIALPVVLCFIPLIAWFLTRKLGGTLRLELKHEARWSSTQKRVLLVFGLTALAWVTRKQPFGGWSGLLELPQANDASVALLAVIALFMLPNGEHGEKKARLLNWESANKIPWGMLLLFAGGITIAKAFTASGLADHMAGGLKTITVLPLLITLFLICLFVTFLTEITSNTATTTLLMPVLAIAAIAADLPPETLMIPAAMSASCAFMLPVATVPNAVVFGSGYINIKTMARAGIALNFIGAFVIATLCYLSL